jgi:hypothetical protein
VCGLSQGRKGQEEGAPPSHPPLPFLLCHRPGHRPGRTHACCLQAKPGVQISRDQRNKRKFVTVVTGLETFGPSHGAAAAPPHPSIGSDSYMLPQISNCRKLPRCFRANCRVGPPSRRTPLARSRSMCRVISSTTCVTNAAGARVPDPRAPLSAALSLPTCPGVRPDQGQLPTCACPCHLPALGTWRVGICPAALARETETRAHAPWPQIPAEAIDLQR